MAVGESPNLHSASQCWRSSENRMQWMVAPAARFVARGSEHAAHLLKECAEACRQGLCTAA